jgi:hypothetical protein
MVTAGIWHIVGSSSPEHTQHTQQQHHTPDRDDHIAHQSATEREQTREKRERGAVNSLPTSKLSFVVLTK